MPRITIYENDNTGATAAADIAGVFVPGSAPLVDKIADAYGCVYIPSSVTDLTEYFKVEKGEPLYSYSSTSGTNVMNVIHLVETLTSLGYGVIYQYVPSAATPSSDVQYVQVDDVSGEEFESNINYVYVNVGTIGEETFNSGVYYTYDGSSYSIAHTYKEGTVYYKQVAVPMYYYFTTYNSTYIPITNYDNTNFYALVGEISSEEFESDTYYTYNGGTFTSAEEWSSGDTYYIQATTFYVNKIVSGLSADANDWNFLNDKNDYNIKFITTGTLGTVPVLAEGDTGYTKVQGTENYTFDFSVANALLQVATNRKDCSLLLDLNYLSLIDNINANTLAKDFKTALEFNGEGVSVLPDPATDKPAVDLSNYILTKTVTVTASDLKNYTVNVSSRAYTAFNNCKIQYSDATGTYTLLVPSSLVYLYRYAQVNKNSVNWLPVTGVSRGVVGDIFTPDIELSKYFLDTQIISDEEGVSFNGIVNLQSYGYTIWGDRTLIEQDAIKGVQATSYFSIRNMVSDIAKIAYESAIQYTYETNNNVTWLNFKQPITSLLDQMVSSGVLQTYSIRRKATTAKERNKMIALISIAPNLPVENFDIYINLENAEVTVSEEVAA